MHARMYTPKQACIHPSMLGVLCSSESDLFAHGNRFLRVDQVLHALIIICQGKRLPVQCLLAMAWICHLPSIEHAIWSLVRVLTNITNLCNVQLDGIQMRRNINEVLLSLYYNTLVLNYNGCTWK